MAADPLPEPPDEVPPRRFAFRTTDPDEAQDFIDRMYAARPPTAASAPLTAPVSISQVGAGGLS
ncbi:MAG: hypothetical protein JO016_10490, partial [Actinobacteria bacterium]|nr:hypothetical protein [Actinomycetota bacterium]